MKELILNKFNSMPQQVEENRRNVKILYEELQKYNLTYRGLYSDNYSYYKNDVVVYGTNTYVHISETATQGVAPEFAPETWALYLVGENVVITAGVKSVDALEPGVQPTVTIETTEVEGEHVKTYDLAFSFGIPKGERGEKGENGTNGTNGTDGVNAVIEGATADLTIINESETESVTVDSLGTQSNRSFAFHFNLKNGKDGTNGTNGATPLLTNINLTIDTLEPGTSAYGTAHFNQTTENVYELNMTLGIPRGNAGINSGEILNAFSADDPTKTYSVTFLNAFYNQVTSQFETVTTDVSGLKEFKTSTETNALWGNNSEIICSLNTDGTEYRFDYSTYKNIPNFISIYIPSHGSRPAFNTIINPIDISNLNAIHYSDKLFLGIDYSALDNHITYYLLEYRNYSTNKYITFKLHSYTPTNETPYVDVLTSQYDVRVTPLTGRIV